jgi:hypothetical protein
MNVVSGCSASGEVSDGVEASQSCEQGGATRKTSKARLAYCKHATPNARTLSNLSSHLLVNWFRWCKVVTGRNVFVKLCVISGSQRRGNQKQKIRAQKTPKKPKIV